MKALIFGISGQDGAYLARHLLNEGYEVIGVSRDAQKNHFHNLDLLDISHRVEVRSASLFDFRSVLQVISDTRPGEIYNLSGQSSVGLSFDLPIETFESVAAGTINILEAIRFLGLETRIYNACSSECFGDVGEIAAVETTPFRPRSPYAVAKSAAFWAISNYREAYDLFACSGILFNHESPLRPERFVTQKIVRSACRIASGSEEVLRLGNLDIFRDWGWAPEYVTAMHRILQHPTPEDFIIATGASYSLRDLVAAAFSYFDLHWRDHVESDPGLLRPLDIKISRADPQKARKVLGWQARYRMPEVVAKMIEAHLARGRDID